MFKNCLLAGSALLFSGVALGGIDLGSMSTPHVDGEMIITFHDDVEYAEQKAILEARGATILKVFESSNSVLVKAAEDENVLYSASVLLESNTIKSTGLNRIFTINGEFNDPSFNKQYQYDLIGSEQAWSMNTGSSDVVVGVIDTGVVYNHPDLVANMWTNEGEMGVDAYGRDKSSNGVDDDGNGYVDDFRGWDFADNDNDPMDDHGHGTHCAGSIGAVPNNGRGIVGLNWKVSIAALRFIDARGNGTEANAIEAIEYATKMGFDITSNSWGGDERPGGNGALGKAVEAAAKKDQLFVAAAGNNGRDTDKNGIFPASLGNDNIISVAASDRYDRLANFSNYGVETVDLMAPGAKVYSTVRGSRYGEMSGTSMAAPIVAAAAALIKAEYPEETALEIKERILKSVDLVPGAKGKVATNGRLNVYKAMTR